MVRTEVFSCCFGGGDSRVQLDFPGGRTTARRLIKEKIHAEVAGFNSGHRRRYGREYRTPEEMIHDEEVRSDRSSGPSFEWVSWEEEARRAIEAWEQGDYWITLDSRKIDAIDDEIVLTPHTDVVFVRLMPFIGG